MPPVQQLSGCFREGDELDVVQPFVSEEAELHRCQGDSNMVPFVVGRAEPEAREGTLPPLAAIDPDPRLNEHVYPPEGAPRQRMSITDASRRPIIPPSPCYDSGARAPS